MLLDTHKGCLLTRLWQVEFTLHLFLETGQVLPIQERRKKGLLFNHQHMGEATLKYLRSANKLTEEEWEPIMAGAYELTKFTGYFEGPGNPADDGEDEDERANIV